MNGPPDPQPEAELRPGSYAGDYVVGARIGSGTFGTVYAAHHPVIGARAAIKVLHSEAARDPEMINRFVDEARAASRAEHPSLIDIYTFGRLPDGRRFIAMERLDGEGLDALIAREAPFTIAACAAVLEPIASALAAAHAAGVVHRDVKPANIFVCAEGPPKLLDFGVAELRDGKAAGAERRGVGVGTPAYMSPEQCDGARTSPASDVYALGVVAFEMLAARLPFESAVASEVMGAHIGDPPPRLDRVRRDLSRATGRAVAAMMAKDPAARPGPVEALAALAATAPRSGSRSRWPMVGGLALTVGLVGGGLWWTSARDEEPVEATPPIASKPVAAAVEIDEAPPAADDAGVDAAQVFTLKGLPTGAEVRLGGQPIAIGPDGILRLASGRAPAEVEITAPGHRPRRLRLEPGMRTVDGRLDPLTGKASGRRKAKDPHDIDPW